MVGGDCRHPLEGELKDRSLSDVKVLDFTGELNRHYASKLYAGLGAEVIHTWNQSCLYD